MQTCDFKRLTQMQLAAAFGCTTRTIRGWCDIGAPRNADRSYDLKAVIEWRISIEAGRVDESTGADSPAIERWRLARAKLSELELAERQGEVIPLAFVRASVARTVEVFKRGLLGQPTKLACSLAALDRPEDCSAELEREHLDLLADLRAGMLRIIGAGEQGEQQEDSDNGRDA